MTESQQPSAQLLWEMAKTIVEFQKKAKGVDFSKVNISELESDWFDWLEEKLIVSDDE
jgi:hypothetical protein